MTPDQRILVDLTQEVIEAIRYAGSGLETFGLVTAVLGGCLIIRDGLVAIAKALTKDKNN
jgi:hypothetical protein